MYFGHVMLLATVAASHDTSGIINGTISITRSHLVQHDCPGNVMFVLASHDSDCIINGTTVLVRSR